MDIKAILESAGYSFEYNDDECDTVFQKIGSDQYILGDIVSENAVNLCLFNDFFNRVTFEGDVDKFIADFTATFDRLVDDYGCFEGGKYA